jgi:hypothetical protein
MYAIDIAVQLSQIWIGIPQVPHNDTMLQTEPRDMSHVAWFPAYLQLDATVLLLISDSECTLLQSNLIERM